MKAKVGDWIRFYCLGVMIIGVVQYVKKRDIYQDEEYYTDKGAVNEDYVFEVRK